jgi:outer membrane receptor for ferrienterochelin and colicin
VQVVGTRIGAMADADGAFVLRGVPVGECRLLIQRTGSKERIEVVTVVAGENRRLNLKLGEDEVHTIGQIDVFGKRKKIDPNSSTIVHEIDRTKIQDTPVDDIMELIGLTSGVVVQAGDLHVKGGRTGELKMLVDGVPVDNALFGGTPDIATASIATAGVETGGLNAERGDALSAVVDVRTREGGERFGGDFQWQTDRYGENTKTFNNFDRLSLGLGGPLRGKMLTWFTALEGVFTDTYLESGKSRSTYHVLDFIRLGNRQSNDVRGSAKLAWLPNPNDKWTFELLGHRGLATPYNHMWSRQGFVAVTFDTTVASSGEARLVPRYGRWSFFAEDSTYVPQNLADHVPTTVDRFDQEKVVWTNGVGKHDVMTFRVSRYRFASETSVQDKEPWEYDTEQPFYWSGNSEVDPYYATHGDFPVWADQSATTWVTKADWTTGRWEHHQAKAGFEALYNGISNRTLQFPNLENDGRPGLIRSDYENFHPQGSAFLQDRWIYEGLVLNAGLRYDVFTPGDGIPDEDLPQGRYKSQVSPRLGVAYPVSQHDVLSFHYGWTYQTPARNFVFENRGSNSAAVVRGNPDLEPETNVAYQAALQHAFSQDVTGQFAVFFKDIYGLVSVRQEVDAVTGLLVPVFVNRDYASARGFEATLRKQFSHRIGGEVNYTYSLATGVASDPNAGLLFAQGNQLYLPISEQALDWDQRHTLNANVNLRQPGRWGLTFLWTYGSGLPFTPTFRNDRRPDPRFTNSRRLPSQSALTIQADKYVRVWGQDVTLFVDARNVLDSKAIINAAPASFPNPFVDQQGNDYLIYYTETGRAGGAYLRDVDGDRQEDWVPVHDPRVYGEGRNIRVGLGVTI